jgi:hypothetical protein
MQYEHAGRYYIWFAVERTCGKEHRREKKHRGAGIQSEALSCVKCEEQKQLISTGFEEELSGEKITVSVGLWCL